MKYWLTILLVICFTFLVADIQQEIKHAETYYWLGINEKGDMQAFGKGLEILDSIKIPDDLPSINKQNLKAEIASLQSDFLFQQDMAHDTFAGVFPLLRLMGNTIFYDAAAYGTYEFIDDPDVIAVSNGAQHLFDNMLSYLKFAPQFGVIFNSIPQNAALENEVRYIFNQNPKFYIHNDLDLRKVLDNSEMEMVKSNKIEAPILKKLFASFSDTHLIFITIKQIDVVDGIYYFLLEARSYEIDSSEPAYSISNMQFTRDKRNAQLIVFALNLLLLVICIVIFYFANKHKSKVFSWNSLPIPIIGFLVGRILPWLLVPIISTFRPEPEMLVKLSFWWLLVLGFALISGILLIHWLITNRLKSIFPALLWENRLGICFVYVALGISAYLTSLILIYDSSLILYALLTIGSVIFLANILGTSLDKKHPASSAFLFLAILLSAFAGLIITKIDYNYLIFLFTVSAILDGILHFTSHKKKSKKQVQEDNEQPVINDIPKDTQELAQRASKPIFQQFASYESGIEIIKQNKGKSFALAVSGPSGRGKTATANALIKFLRKNLENETLILRGECPNEANQKPYAPIQQALGSIVGINLSSATQTSAGNMDSLLDGILDTIIPFSSLLIPSGEGNDFSLDSKQEIHEIILRSVLKLSRKQNVILFFDDVQWIDAASQEMLSFICQNLPETSDHSITIICTSRDNSKILEMTIPQKNIIELASPTYQEKLSILHDGLGLQKDFAGQILDLIGNVQDKRGELFFLLKTISFLAQEGAFERSENGFVLSDKYPVVNKLPVPAEYSETVEQQIEQLQQHKYIIECAACLGLEFSAGLLSECLGIPRLEMLLTLDEIEKKTNLIYDVRASDDVYAFQSSFSLEIIREKLQITKQEIEDFDAPQLIREYNARVAQTLEKKSGSSVFDIASHYYAAGANYAEKGLHFCIKAAHAAGSVFQHENARKYLKMAAKCAKILGRSKEMASEFLMLKLKESHVQNIGQQELAEKCLRFLENNPELSTALKLAITRCFYEAALSSRDQKYFAAAVELARSILALKADELEKAEAYQFVAICLPPSESAEIIENLQKARELLQPMIAENLKTKELLSRVENSLAEKLSYGSNDNKKLAHQLFENSIKTKEEFNDLPGLARSYGGLGRLLIEENQFEEAEEYFQKDLEICQQISDVGGQTKMHSFIADCKLKQNDFEAARKIYEQSYEMAAGLNDKLFAVRGYLIASAGCEDAGRSDEMGKLLVENYDTAVAIWKGFFQEVISAAEKNDQLAKSEWFRVLKKKEKSSS